MRKTFLFLTLIALAVFNQSCGDNNDSPNNPDKGNKSINPPEWIQGTWGTPATEFSEAIPAFRFTEDDVITISVMQEMSHKEAIKNGEGVYKKLEVKETITDSKYRLKMTFNESSIIYEFVKVNIIEGSIGIPIYFYRL